MLTWIDVSGFRWSFWNIGILEIVAVILYGKFLFRLMSRLYDENINPKKTWDFWIIRSNN